MEKAKKTEGKKPKKVSQKQIQYRCSLLPMIKIFKKIKEKGGYLIDQLNYLKQTPFEKFMLVFFKEILSIPAFTKSSTTLDDIIETFSINDEAFKVGNIFLKIKPEDIAIIFSLPLSGVNIFPVPKMSLQILPDNCKDFVLRNFGTIEHITKDLTISKINNVLETQQFQHENDFPKLLIILAMITFFFPDNQRYLPWGYIPYILDQNKMNSVSWPVSIHHSLIRALTTFKTKPRNMPGCSMLPIVSTAI